VDYAYSDSDRADATAMVAGRVSAEAPAAPSELWLFAAKSERIPARELQIAMAAFLKKHQPSKTIVESTNGSVWLRMLLEAELRRLEINPHIMWLPAHRTKGGKVARIQNLIKLHLADRLRLVAADWTDEFIKQAERWQGSVRNSCRHDDLLDSSSMLCRFVGA
jgi:hypothetical protein